jgi:CRISPR system Cascade subunit CasC
MHWEELRGVTEAASEGQPARGRSGKQAAGSSLPPAVRGALLATLDGGKAADLALFGRMLADMPDRNVDAAAQVAHAISTNRVAVEFDFYTAVDDFNPADTAGAGMMGTVEFNSACFYRYANVDLRQLRKNLEDDALVESTVAAFVRAAVEAVPTGKQNSMAAHNPPSFVLAVARQSGLWNLANAFVRTVAPRDDGDLVTESIRRLDRHWGDLVAMYGARPIVGTAAAVLGEVPLEHLRDAPVDGVDALVEKVKQWIGTGSVRSTAA